jgi:endonuclease III
MTGNPKGLSKEEKLRKARAKKILLLIRSAVHSTTALGTIRQTSHSDPFRILISTILSQRTRDSVTERVSAQLFEKYHDPISFAGADLSELAAAIRPVSFYNQKAVNIVETSKQLLSAHGGEVPKNYSQLLQLPGVGRKTAGCVLVYGFAEPAIPVDTHVHRVSNRIGLVHTKNPDDTEAALERLYDKKYWIDINELFVSFGQTVCLPVTPKCSVCPVKKLCSYYRSKSRGT